MKTNRLITTVISVLLLNANALIAQNTYVPDDKFEQALIELGYDSGILNDSVPTVNIETVTLLNVNGKNISNLTGIKDFTSLTTLNCSNNNLTLLNTSNNLSLLELVCFNNQINTFDLSTNTNLTGLVCYNNNLTEIDLSAAPALITLNCSNNQISSLDLSKNISLKYVNCSNNKLQSLNLKNGNNNNMTGGNNWETGIDSRKNHDLFCIQVDNVENTASYYSWFKDSWSEYNENCSAFEVVMVYVPDDNFEQVLINLGYDSGTLNDSVPITSIKYVENLNISSRNITNLTGIEHFTSLKKLYCSNNKISSLNLSNNTNLIYLDCSNNLLTQLDLYNNTILQNLYCGYNKLIDLDLSSNSNITKINCYYNELTGLNVRNGNNSNLQLDTRYNSNLFCIQVDDASASNTYYNWYKNAYTAYSENCSGYVVEMTYIPDDKFEQALIDLGFDAGVLNDSVPTNAIMKLKSLNISYKNITDLTGIEDFFALEQLYCNNNQISEIDLKTISNLKTLQIHNNKLSDLDISSNPFITSLNSSSNQLTGLNLRNGNNANMSVDVRYNPDLLCIQVDNEDASYTYSNWYKNAYSGYSEDCSSYKVKMIYVPDDNFEQVLVELGMDYGPLNDSIPEVTAKSVKLLNISYNTISDLTGIEKFTQLENFYCHYNKIDSLDLTHNIKLKDVNCFHNQIAFLEVPPSVQRLECDYNMILEIDLSRNSALYLFTCTSNQLTGLNLKNGNNPNLQLNTRNNPNLMCIQVDNPEASLEYSNWYKDLIADYALDCSTHKTKMTYVPDDNFEQTLIDLGYDAGELNDSVPNHAIEKIKTLYISHKNIADLTGIDDFISLEELYCNGNQISEINLKNNLLLTNLSCEINNLTYLDMHNNTSLVNLNCEDNQLHSLNLRNGNNHNMHIYCRNNFLICIEVDNPAQTPPPNTNWFMDDWVHYSSDCSGNKLEMTYVPDDNFEQALINLKYDFGELNDSVPTQIISKINTLFIGSLEIQDLTGIEDFTLLETLSCGQNQISDLNLSSNTLLRTLHCNNNYLTSLNLSSNVDLVELNCSLNDIKVLDLSVNPKLKGLNCSNNELIYLNISNGNNNNLGLYSLYNEFLSCIQVDDPVASENYYNWHEDAWAGYSEDCTYDFRKTYIPDDNFEQALIDLGYDSGELDDSVLTANIIAINDLNISNKNISSLQGIEAFPNLYSIDCSNNTINQLNLNNNKQLTSVVCRNNLILELLVDSLLNLEYLDCVNNKLTTIDISYNPILSYFNCSVNQLAALNVKSNLYLVNLFCHYNQITELDLHLNQQLTELYCGDNQILTLDLSKNKKLTLLYCHRNNLSELNIKNGYNRQMSFEGTLFVAQNNPNLTCIQVDNPIASESYTNWYKDDWASYSEDCSSTDEMTYIPDDNFEQALIDLGYDSGALDDSVNTKIIIDVTTLNVSNRNISNLTGIEDFGSLTSLICSLNQLTELNLNNNKNLNFLECGSNNLDSLNVDSLNLTHISCSYNNLSVLKFNNSSDLIHLNCAVNSLKTINLTNNQLLEELLGSNNRLKELDLSSHTNLSKVFLFDNELTILNLQNGYNQNIVNLDVSDNPNLSCIQIDNVQEANSFVGWTKDNWTIYSEDCSNQDIRKTYIPDHNFEQALIDLGYDSGELDDSVLTVNIENVSALYIQDKNIGDLTGIQDFINLTYLNCNENQLTILDLSNNHKLNSLYCHSNHLYSLNIQNGNNRKMIWEYGHEIMVFLNPGLNCIQVDDAIEAETYTGFGWFKDTRMYYSEKCESVNDRIPVSEYEALNALYNSLDGENWSYNYNWLDTINHVVDDWYGITVENGHVTQIYLNNTKTLGFIPKELGNLTELRKLHLRYCGLSGGIPIELSNLKKLEYLNLSSGHLGPQFIDGIPNQERCIPDELENLDSLNYFNIDYNMLMFNDLEAVYSWKNFNNFQFIYHAQYPKDLGYNEISLEPNENFTFTLEDYLPGPSDKYQWIKNNDTIVGATGKTLVLNNIQPSDNGSYYCRVSNSIATDATISFAFISLTVHNGSGPKAPNSEYKCLVNLYNSTHGDEWTNNTHWLDTINYTVNDWYGITADTGFVRKIELPDNNLTGSFLEDSLNMPGLEVLDVRGNNLNAANFRNLEGSYSLTSVHIENNNFVFKHIKDLQNLNIYNNFRNNFTYSPQSKIDKQEEIKLKAGDTLNIRISPSYISTGDQIQWYYNDLPLNGHSSYDYIKLNVTVIESGTYYAKITNPDVPGLILQSYNKEVEVKDYTGAGVPNSEYNALVDFYNNLDGDNWSRNDNWLDTTNYSVGDWHGITVTNNHVTEIEFGPYEYYNLNGSLPNSIGALTHLESLTIVTDNLHGEIPLGLFELTQLKTLYISECNLSGPLPKGIGNLTNLEELGLEANNLEGPVPNEIGNLKKLKFLALYENNFSGEIPQSIGELTNLWYLGLADNKFTGKVPTSFGNLTNLLFLLLHNNQLVGPLPDELANLTNIKKISVKNNQIGNIDLNKSGQLDNNRQIPDELAGLLQMDTLYLGGNNLQFNDIEAIFSWENYNSFHEFIYTPQDSIGINTIKNSQLGGTITLGISNYYPGPSDKYQWYKNNSAIQNATEKTLELSDLQPDDIGKYYCKITNPVATNLTLNSRFITLSVIENAKGAGVPQKEFTALVELYNNFKGDNWFNNENWLDTIAYSVGDWHGISVENGNITALDLSELNLEGDISFYFADFDSLKWLDLSNNKLSGEFPGNGVANNSTVKSDGNSNQILKYLDISNNNFVFAELEPAFDFFQTIDTFIYAPQSMVGLPFDTTIYKNQPVTFKIANYTTGSFDSYSWSKDGTTITDANEITLAIQNAAPGYSGYYTCTITNLLFPELTLLSDTSRLKVLIAVGIDDFNNAHFNIYPNPADKQIFVETGNMPVNLKLFDITGSLFFGKDDFMSGWINIEPFSRGIYIVRITSQNSETITKKVIFK